jgi:arabinan endo-1,5-alpha-L-arabinosidase
VKRALVLLAACGGHDAVPDAVPDAAGPPQLVAYYAMDNDANIEGAIDMGGHHLDGNCSIDECPTLIAGHLGMAYHFDGAMQHLRTPDNGMFTLRRGFSIVLWVKQDLARNDTLLAKPLSTAGESWQINIANGHGQFCTTHAGTESCLAGAMVPTGQWGFLAATWDGKRKHVYVAGTATDDTADATTDFDTTVMVIGADIENGVLATPYQGAVDELRIFDGALTAADVAGFASM